MPSLETRIAALEQKDTNNDAPRVWLIRLVGMEDEPQPLTQIRYEGRTWNILPGESEEAFTDRVKAEVFPEPGKTGVMLIAD